MQGKAQGSPGRAPDFGTNTRESLASWNRASLSWKTSQLCLLEGSTPFSERWPISGTMRSGQLYARPTWALRTDASGSLSWPTPRSCSAMAAEFTEEALGKLGERFPNLETVTASWATPKGRDWKDTPGMAISGVNPDGSVRNRLDQLPAQSFQWDGTTRRPCEAPTEPSDLSQLKPRRRGLNPRFGLWLMGFPVAWLDCAPLGTQSSRNAPKSSAGAS